MNRKNHIDFPDYSPKKYGEQGVNLKERADKEKQFKGKQFLKEYHFRDSRSSVYRHREHNDPIIYKTKEIPSTMKAIFKDPLLLKSKVQVLTRLSQAKIDFRVLSQLKTGFLAFMNKTQKKQVKLASLLDFRKFISSFSRSIDSDSAQLIIEQIQDDAHENVVMSQLAQLVDFYTHYPLIVKQDRNKSDELYIALSGGLFSHANNKASVPSPSSAQLRRSLELIWSKIDERFSLMQQAFIFFDGGQNAQISLGEFEIGL